MLKLRLNEALAFALGNGKNIKRSDIADALWGSSSLDAKKVNMSNLSRGKTKRIEIWWIKKICELTGVDANFLLGIKKLENGS